MKEAVVARIGAEISFFLAILSGIFFFGDQLGAILALIAGVLVCGLVAVQLEHGFLRFLVALVPAASVLLAHNLVLQIAMGLALVYFVLMMTLGNFDAEYLTVHFIMELMAVILAVFFFALVARSISMNEPADNGLLIGAFLFLTLGIVALRGLRLNISMPFKQHLTNTAVVFAPALVGIGLGAGVYWLLKTFGEYLLYPFVLLIQWLYSLGGEEKVHERPQTRPVEFDPFRKVDGAFNPGSQKMVEDSLEEGEPSYVHLPEVEVSVNWELVLGIAAVVIVLVLILVYVGMHRKNQKKSVQYEGTVGMAEEKSRRRRSKEPLDNAAKVRRIYKEYLFFLRSKGVEIETDDTSKEILDDSKQLVTGDEDELLRQIYIRARYASGDEITADDVSFAESYLKQLKEENKNKRR